MRRRITCPYCGSSAQLTLEWEDGSKYSTSTVSEYSCGCGCSFITVFSLQKIIVDDKVIDVNS